MARRRTFLAIDLNPKVRAHLVSLQEELTVDAPDVAWVEPENLHVTLLFLGEVDHRECIDICRAAHKAVAKIPSFAMTVEAMGAFPNARRPRTLWVGVGDGKADVIAVHDAIEEPLLEMGSYRRETRAYTPHVTLGRVKGERNDEALAKALTKHAAWSAGEAMVNEVQVMTSELTSDGPIYTVVGRAKLA
jgi:RNA 2',3'-cyclic 3'-phosphodiesterase